MKFLALFLLIPLVEVAVFIKVGGSIGAFWTVVLTVGTALLGAILVRLQGMATLFNVKQELMQGQMPAGAVLEGVILLVSGAMLLTPGFVTDTLGFLGLVPGIRQRAAQALLQHVVTTRSNAQYTRGQTYDGQATSEPRGSKTIEGDWTRED